MTSTKQGARVDFGEPSMEGQVQPLPHANLLPCAIKYNGDAPVQDYFQPTYSGVDIDGIPVMNAAFRGRCLKGAPIPIGEGFTGFVLEKQPKAAEEAPDHWHATAHFTDLTYWNHDTVPTSADLVRRTLEWTTLAHQVHAPVPAHAVEQMQAELATGL